jgi:protein involved in polysaccharide export with SLBB domain
MYISRKIILFLAFFVYLNISNATAQDLKNSNDWSQVKADQLSDADLAKMQSQLQSSGMTADQAQQLALSKGLPASEWDKLKARLGGKNGNAKNGNADVVPVVDRTAPKDDYKTTPKPPSSNVFGASFFDSESLTFEPNLRIATPVNYILGPDDQLEINVSGYQETNIELTVSPEGKIFIPQVGSINVTGLTVDQATSVIRSRLSSTAYRSLKNGTSKLIVSLGKIRSIHITIVGADKPGNYTVSSLATVFNSLYLSGGPGDINTYRDIELIRNNKVFEHIDLYQFLTRGDQSGNILLKENDVINFPVYKKHVTIKGQVKRAGVFELKDGETFDNLLFFAGGYTDNAYRASIKVKQITDTQRQIKDIAKAAFSTYRPSNGDEFQVDAVLERFENGIAISGAVFRPGQFELTPGITISGLIKRAGGLMENVYTDRATLSRRYPNGTKENITFNVATVMNGGPTDVPLIKYDSVSIANATQFITDYKVQILGEVRKPGAYDYRDDLSLRDLFFMANGFTDAASSFHVEVSRRLTSERSNKSADTIAKVFDITTEKSLNIENEKFIVKPYDVVTVRRNPGYSEQQRVNVSGEVNYPGSYTIQSKKEHVSDLLRRSGGLTSQAYPGGIFLIRKDLDTTGQKQTVESIQTSLKDSSTKVIVDVARSNARIAVNLKEVLEKPGSIQDYVLQDGDSLRVLKIDPLVKISGEVLSSTRTGYIEGESMRYYLTQAGGPTDNARRRKIYALYPNGHIGRTHNFLGVFRFYPKVVTGSEIIVPRKLEGNGMSTAETISLTTAVVSLVSLIIVTISTLKR